MNLILYRTYVIYILQVPNMHGHMIILVCLKCHNFISINVIVYHISKRRHNHTDHCHNTMILQVISRKFTSETS